MSLFELLSEYYANTTDRQIEVNAENIRMFYRASTADPKIIVLINAVTGSRQTVSDSLVTNIRDKAATLIFSRYGSEPSVISVICADDFEAVKDSTAGCSYGDERWIVDENKMCIMLTQEQTVYDKKEYDTLTEVLRAEEYSRRPDEEKLRKVKNTVPLRRASERRRVSDGIKYAAGSVTFWIILVNFLVFIWLEIIGDTLNPKFMFDHGAMYWKSVIEDGEYYRLFTCMFIHFGFDHLLGNMFSLFIMGYIVEKIMGKVRFATIYFVSGITASIVSLAYHYRIEDYSVCAGASGAIYGVMGALLVIFIFGRGLGGLISARGLIIYLIVGIGNGVLYGVVDNSAHIGGFIGGAALTYILIQGMKNSSR